MQDAPAPMTPEIAQRIHDALHDYADVADGSLDALLANDTSPSPWFWLAAVTVGVTAALAVAAMVVFRPRPRITVGATDPATLWRKHLVELSKENRQRVKVGLPVIPEPVDGEFTFTPAADTDDLLDLSVLVNLDAKDGDR